MLVLSQDVNTMPAAAYRRLEDGHSLTGLLMVPQTLPVAEVIEDVLLIWSASDTAEWRGQVWFLSL